MPNLTFKGKQFYMDGEPIEIISGTMHYFRIPEDYWYDRLLRSAALTPLRPTPAGTFMRRRRESSTFPVCLTSKSTFRPRPISDFT